MFHDRPMTAADTAWHEGSLEGRIEELAREAARLGHPLLLARMDQIEAQLRDLRDADLALVFDTPQDH